MESGSERVELCQIVESNFQSAKRAKVISNAVSRLKQTPIFSVVTTDSQGGFSPLVSYFLLERICLIKKWLSGFCVYL